MRVFVIGRYSPRRAAVMPIMEMQFAAGFAHNNCEVKYIVPHMFGAGYKNLENIFKKYGLPMVFKIVFLPTFFNYWPPHYVIGVFQLFWHSLLCLKLCLIDGVSKGPTLVFSNDVNALIPYILMSKIFNMKNLKVLVWVFDLRYVKWRRYLFVYKKASGIVVPNTILIKALSKELKIPKARFVLSYHPINESRLKFKSNKALLRKQLGLDNNKPLIVYTGKIFVGQKEIEYILETAKSLSRYQFILTSGQKDVISYYKDITRKKNIENVLFTGLLPTYADVKYYQSIADVLVAYYTIYDKGSYGDPEYNLPAKICEYMVSGNPIVTCDRAGTRDLLNKDNALFVEPDNSLALAAGIKKLVEDKDLAERLAKNAYDTVKEITFEKRTKVIIDFAANRV